jgi:hypothetical protein
VLSGEAANINFLDLNSVYGIRQWLLFELYIYIYPAMTAFTDQYSLPNIFFDIGQL